MNSILGTGACYIGAGRCVGLLNAGYSDLSLAAKWLGGCAKRTIETISTDHWRWQYQNLKGYV